MAIKKKTDIDNNLTPPAEASSWCISYNYVPAVLLGLVINSPGADGDSDNYLESGAVASDTHFVSGSAPSGSALSGSAPDTYSGSGSGAVAPDTNAAPDTNRYAAPDANYYSASNTNHYAAPNANCSDAPKNNHSAAPDTNRSDANNCSAAPVINIDASKTIHGRSSPGINFNIISETTNSNNDNADSNHESDLNHVIAEVQV
ncbi:14214_t:CDS:2 [Dentiscutata heterogama]|uniref:14214_t:CDS:1 n=1 Tax=Dentiscutata heterogama TaxID=1316150 RepID=A0ACA9LL38_9GLOM|nr:14214_t:CDS:2 [Dentiscutata heterogama]